jgi:hypothetical protein
MPDAEAAILAVGEFVPTTIEALLHTARKNYRTSTPPSVD